MYLFHALSVQDLFQEDKSNEENVSFDEYFLALSIKIYAQLFYFINRGLYTHILNKQTRVLSTQKLTNSIYLIRERVKNPNFSLALEACV